MPFVSCTIFTVLSHYLEAPNGSLLSSSVINRFLNKSKVPEADVTKENKKSEGDRVSLVSGCVFSPHLGQNVGYLAGFVSLKLKGPLKWELWWNPLFTQNPDATHGLTLIKNEGQISSPSRDVAICLCLVGERKYRKKVLLYGDQPYAKMS